MGTAGDGLPRVRAAVSGCRGPQETDCVRLLDTDGCAQKQILSAQPGVGRRRLGLVLESADGLALLSEPVLIPMMVRPPCSWERLLHFPQTASPCSLVLRVNSVLELSAAASIAVSAASHPQRGSLQCNPQSQEI